MAKANPSFLLRGIDPNEILKKYKSGFFERDIPKKEKIVVIKKSVIVAPVYGKTNRDKIFTINDNGNDGSSVIVTTGHENYELYGSNGGELPEGGRCDNCKCDFHHKAIGYPVAYEEKYLLCGKGDEKKYRVIYVFWMEGEICSFECALTFVNMFIGPNSEYKNNNLIDSSRWLKFLYSLMYPNEPPLTPSNDFRLLSSNKGPLVFDEWINPKHVYLQTDRVLLLPAKEEYLQKVYESSDDTTKYHINKS